VVAIFAYAIPKFANYGSVWAILRTLTWPQLGLLAATLFNLVAYWAQLMASLPGLTLGQAAVNNQTTTSIANTVPGGGVLAVGVAYAMLRSWGFSLSAITPVDPIDRHLERLPEARHADRRRGDPGPCRQQHGCPAGARADRGGRPGRRRGRIRAADVEKEFALRIGQALGVAWSWLRRLVRKPPVTGWDQAAVRFRRQSNDLVARRWPALTLTTLVSTSACTWCSCSPADWSGSPPPRSAGPKSLASSPWAG
jgi:hypothetical protein